MGEPLITDAPVAPVGDAPGAGRRRRIAPFAVLGVTIVVGVLFAVLAGSKAQVNTETAASPLIGKAAPSIVDRTIDGEQFDLARMRGSWVVLNFFQTTCRPCVAEHPELVEFARQQAALPDGAKLISIVWNDNDAAVRKFFADNGGGWPVVEDPDGSTAFDYGVAKVPETWVIDPQGRVIVHYVYQIAASEMSARLQQMRDLATGAG